MSPASHAICIRRPSSGGISFQVCAAYPPLKLTPEVLTGSSDYNESYYEIIDKIENEIFNKGSLEELLSEYEGIKINEIKELNPKNVETDLQDIFNYK